MPGCASRCANIDTTTYSGAWWSARSHYGPGPESMNEDDRLDLYGTDLADYSDWLSAWNNEHGGGIVDTSAQFAKWLNWRFSIGTSALSNLPRRKRGHVGISCAPCPYDTKADDVRSEIMLGSVPSKVDHGVYYMKVSGRGSAWGFECTYSGCPYTLANGSPYFYV